MAKHICLFLFAFVFAAGCSTTGQVREFLWPDYDTDFQKVSKKWTREDSIYRGFDPVLHVTATLASVEWQEAFATKYAEVYAMSDEEYESFRNDLLADRKSGLAFVVTLSSFNEKIEKLDAGKAGNYAMLKFGDALWEVFLMVNGEKRYPEEIRQIKWSYEKLRIFYPFANPWQQFYVVRFAPDETVPVVLNVVGPAGKVRFEWDAQ